MTEHSDLPRPTSTEAVIARESGEQVGTLQSAGAAALGGAIRELGPWFHNLHLPDGVQTAPDHPLGDFPSNKWKHVGSSLPTDLSGCRALDIGCNAGFYSFELARRGADVVAIDHDPHYLRQAAWARDRFELAGAIEFRRLDVYDLAAMTETFDVVLFLGVLYHLRYPLLALDLVAERTRGTLVLQTLTIPGGDLQGRTPFDLSYDERQRLTDEDWPKMSFVEHQFAGDPTNWWVPNAGAVEAMARTSGFTISARLPHEIWICERNDSSFHHDELLRATGRRPR